MKTNNYILINTQNPNAYIFYTDSDFEITEEIYYAKGSYLLIINEEKLIRLMNPYRLSRKQIREKISE